ncbi:hypothetical protein GCM10020331_055730 [Ectobacillus funiculus]
MFLIFEWVQNNQGYYWTEEEVDNKLKNHLNCVFLQVHQTAITQAADMRLAAYIVGLKKMVEASKYRGWI